MTEPGRQLILGVGWFPDQAGGLNRYATELVRALANAGAQPHAVVLGPVHAAPPGVVVAAHHSDRLLTRLWMYRRAAVEQAQHAELIDIHFALYAAPFLVTSRRLRQPVVTHFQGPWADECAAMGDRSRVRHAVRRAVERSVYRRAHAFVTLSHAFKRVLVERYGVSPWTVEVIPPGVDLGYFSPLPAREERSATDNRRWVALTARRLVPRTGVDLLLEAWARISHPAKLLLIAGDGPSRAGLEAKAVELGIEESTRFLGKVTDSELRDHYRKANVCVIPSIALEGFGLVALEALACGTPVVVTDVGGLPESVAELDRTLVVPADSGALAARLEAALNGSAPLPTRDQCRRYAEQFSWDRVLSLHRALYERLDAPDPERQLRVVYLDHTAVLSGGELALLHTLPHLDAVKPHVVLGEDGPLASRLVQAGVSVEVFPLSANVHAVRREHVVPGGVSVRAVLATAIYVLRLARRLRQIQPDLVETNSLKSAVYGGLAARLVGVPVVWHVRDRIAEDYLPAFAVRAIRRLSNLIPDAVVANSRETLGTLNVVRRPFAVIPSPVVIDSSHSREPGYGAPDDELRIGILGRIAPWKGQHLFLEAFARAFRAGGAKGIVIGAPLFREEGYRAELHALATELGIDDRVEFLGFREDVGAELAKLDILVHASTLPEPWGQVVLEGMASGLPVLAPAAGGPNEIIEHDVTGILYRPNNVDALARALTRLAGDEELRRRLGAAARERAAQFRPECIVDRVTAVYAAVMEQAGTRSLEDDLAGSRT